MRSWCDSRWQPATVVLDPALLAGAPHLALLLLRALRDPRISSGTKANRGTGLYVFSPVDLMAGSAGAIGVFGYGDDALVVVHAIDRLINEEDPEVIADLWTGRPEEPVRAAELHRAPGTAQLNRWIRPVARRLLARLFH